MLASDRNTATGKAARRSADFVRIGPYVLAGEEASDSKDIQRMRRLQGMLNVLRVIL
jgi:hypothetical protein